MKTELKKEQAKIIKKWGLSKDTTVNCLLHSDGTMTIATGVEHCDICKLAGVNLGKYLISGGIRVKVAGSSLFIESICTLTEPQKTTINSIIRKGGFGEVGIEVGVHYDVVEDFRRVTPGKCEKYLNQKGAI